MECLLSVRHYLNSVLGFPHSVLKTTLPVGQYCIIIIILGIQMRKLKHRKEKSLSQSHRASKWMP